MASTGVINGTILRAYSSGTAIAKATNCTLTVNREVRETVHKDNPGSGWREVEIGRKTATLTVEAMYGEDGTQNPDTFFDALDNGTLLAMKLSTEVSGDSYYSFSGYCTSWEANGPVEENSSYSCTFEVDGAITRATN